MIKKDITFTDYNDQEVTKSFYFNFNKLEGVELELEYGGLEEKMEELAQTEDSKQAYMIFKDILLRAVGKKSPDGSRFIKSPDIRSELEDSPALAELIFEFFENPGKVAAFFEGMLPAKDVAEGRARLERERLMKEAEASKNESAISPAIESAEPKVEKTDQELLETADITTLSNEELERLLTLRKQ